MKNKLICLLLAILSLTSPFVAQSQVRKGSESVKTTEAHDRLSNPANNPGRNFDESVLLFQ